MGLFLVILAPAFVSLAEVGRGLYCDTLLIRTVTLRTEIGQLRSGLARRAGRLEHYLESEPTDDSAAPLSRSLANADAAKLLAKVEHRGGFGAHEAYWAMVDPEGHVLLHSGESYQGKRLTTAWDDDKQSDIGDDVVRLQQPALFGDRKAYDVNLPLYAHGQCVGTLHSGLDAAAIDDRIEQDQRSFISQQSWTIALWFLVNAAAIGGLAYIARRYAGIHASMKSQHEGESRKLTQIGFGLAHEIRNPLHAIRINTHTLRRSLAGKTLSDQELTEMMRESCDEIDRIESIMRELVQYVSPPSSEEPVELEMNREAQAILQLHGEELRKRNIEVTFMEEKSLLIVRAVPSQIRSILHELLTFAQKNAGEGGQIEIQLRAVEKSAEMLIIDHGRELSQRDLENLFEPFHATPSSEAGLNLALIRQFVRNSGGTIIRTQSSEGNRFELRLPLIQQTPQGQKS